MSKGLRVLFVSSSSGSQGGGELYLVYLGAALKKRGHTPILWASDDKMLDGLCEQFAEFGEVKRASYTNTYWRKSRSLYYIKSLFKTHRDLAQSWEALEPDVIHLNKQCLEDGLDLLVAAKQTKVPHLAFLHITQSAMYLRAQYAPPRDWISKKILANYDGPLITHTNRIPELTEFLPNHKRIAAIDNGVTLPNQEEYETARAQCRTKLGLNDNDFLITGIGRFETQKRPHLFREIALKLSQKIPNSRVLWVGAGRLEDEWDRWVSENDKEKVFSRIGWQRTVLPHLAATDLYLHPAGYEGLPFSLLEAMAWNNPCILMEDLAEALNLPDPSAIIAAPLDRDDWHESLTDKQYLNDKAYAARKLIENEYSIDIMAQKYEKTYFDLIETA